MSRRSRPGESPENRLQALAWWAWLALLVCLPITSQPQVAEIVGGRPVGPLSIVPLVIVVAIGIVPHMAGGGRIPRPAAPLLVFAGLAAASSLLAPWLGLLPYKGQDVIGRGMRGLATLAIGIAFYLAAALQVTDQRRLRHSLRAAIAGAVPMLIWSSVQLVVVLDPAPLVPQWIDDLHEWFSLRAPFANRVTGMAYEPSWLADMLVVFYLPLWVGGLLRRVSAFDIRLGKVTVEHALVVWGAVILVGTLSRVGLAAAGLVVAALALAGGWGVAGRLAGRTGGGQAEPPSSKRRSAVTAGVLLAVVLGLALMAGLGVWGLAQVDSRVARILERPLAGLTEGRHPPAYTLATRLRYAERVMYWEAAARTFSRYPLTGVGLGNTGFLFRDVMPPFGYLLPEILEGLDPGSDVFPNPKSLWFRLLAETGLIGTAAFAAWLAVTGAVAWQLWRRADGLWAAIGLASLLSLVALLAEGFSLDTFALPYLWLLPGMAAAGWRLQ